MNTRFRDATRGPFLLRLSGSEQVAIVGTAEGVTGSWDPQQWQGTLGRLQARGLLTRWADGARLTRAGRAVAELLGEAGLYAERLEQLPGPDDPPADGDAEHEDTTEKGQTQ